jgi:hypothetical protein
MSCSMCARPPLRGGGGRRARRPVGHEAREAGGEDVVALAVDRALLMSAILLSRSVSKSSSAKRPDALAAGSFHLLQPRYRSTGW